MNYGIELNMVRLKAPFEGEQIACKLEALDLVFKFCHRSLLNCKEVAVLALTNPDL